MSTDYISPPKELPPGSIVWAYLRSATKDSNIRQQETEITAYCKQYNLVLNTTFVDEAKNGCSTIERDAFNDLIEMSTDPANRPAGIIVWDFARFSRNLDDSKHYRALLRERGIILHSMNDPVAENRCRGILETSIDIAKEEIRRQNSRDVKRALRCMTKQGYSCGGKPPQGYLAEKVVIGEKRDGNPRRVSRWVPDPKLWDLVKLAWQLRAEGKTYTEIRDATDGNLYKQGSSFSAFFNNKTYLGIGKCGDLEVPNHHEAAIDQETWDKVRKISKSRRQSPKNDHHKT
jgi:DNA invertase Pin-like site-specific DNA recombinase